MNGSSLKNLNTLAAAVSEAVVGTPGLFVKDVIPHLVSGKSSRHFYELLSLNNARTLFNHLQVQELENHLLVVLTAMNKH